jgi:hypothetical protein
MKYLICIALIFAAIENYSAQSSINDVVFYNAQNETVKLSEKSVVIVCTQLNCRGCFDFLKRLKQKTSKDVTWYCLFDYTQLPVSQRPAAIGNIESFIKIPGIQYIFLADKTPKNFRNSIQLCQSDHTPHLILSKENTPIKGLPHEHLFSEDADEKKILLTIKEYFKGL